MLNDYDRKTKEIEAFTKWCVVLMILCLAVGFGLGEFDPVIRELTSWIQWAQGR